MNEEMLMQLLMQLANSSPNEEFGVQPAQGGGNLGMSPDSQVMGQALNQMQGSGMQPPMPAETGGGPETQMLLMQLVQALKQMDLGGQMQQPEQGMSDGTVGGSNELLKALLGGS